MKCGFLASWSHLPAVGARADARAAELDADSGRSRIRVIRFDVADPVLVNVAAQQHGIGERVLAHRGDQAAARGRVAVPAVVPERLAASLPEVPRAEERSAAPRTFQLVLPRAKASSSQRSCVAPSSVRMGSSHAAHCAGSTLLDPVLPSRLHTCGARYCRSSSR
jgi:hypothetical protein